MARTVLSEVLPGQIFGLRSAKDMHGQTYIIDPYNNVCSYNGKDYTPMSTMADLYNLPFEPYLERVDWPFAKGMRLTDSQELPLADGIYVQGFLSGRVYKVNSRKLEDAPEFSPANANGYVPLEMDFYNIVDTAISKKLVVGTKPWDKVLDHLKKQGGFAWRFTATGSRVYISSSLRTVTYRDGECRKLNTDTLKKSGWCLTNEVPKVVETHFAIQDRSFTDTCSMAPQAPALISSAGTIWLRDEDYFIDNSDDHVKFKVPAGYPKSEEKGWKPYHIQTGVKPRKMALKDFGKYEDFHVAELWHPSGLLIHIDSATVHTIERSGSGEPARAVPTHLASLPEDGWYTAKFDGSYDLDLESAANAARTTGVSTCNHDLTSSYRYVHATRTCYLTTANGIEIVSLPFGRIWVPDRSQKIWDGQYWLRPEGEIYHHSLDGKFYVYNTGKVTVQNKVMLPTFKDGNYQVTLGPPEWFQRYLKLTPSQRLMRGAVNREAAIAAKAGRVATKVLEEYRKRTELSAPETEPEPVQVGPPPSAKIEGSFTAEQIVKLISDLKSLAETMSKQGSHAAAEKLSERITYLAGSVSWSLK